MLFVWKGISMYEYCVLLSLQRTCGVLFTVYNVGQISTTRRQICWRFGVTVKIGKSLIDTLIKEVDKKSTWLWTGRPWRAVFIFLFLEITLQSLFKCQGIFNWLTRFFWKNFSFHFVVRAQSRTLKIWMLRLDYQSELDCCRLFGKAMALTQMETLNMQHRD